MTFAEFLTPIYQPYVPDVSKIRALNDAFRTSFIGGRIVITHGASCEPPEILAALCAEVQRFDSFTQDNDPHGEHDFGMVELGDSRYFWKIDTYDTDMAYGSERPDDPDQTCRVLTIMLAEDY